MTKDMQTFTGTVKVRQVNPGSKSEGTAAWLETIFEVEPKLLRLYRSDMPEVNDPLFSDLDGQQVSIIGKLESPDYLCVANLTIISPTVNQTSINDQPQNNNNNE